MADLTDAQWEVLEPLLGKPVVRDDGRGRPWRDPRDVLNGILWVMRTGAPWQDLPNRYPSPATCHRRFQQWTRDGTLNQIRRTLLTDLNRRGKLRLDEGFIDGTFVPAKKGALESVLQSVEKAPRSWQLSTVASSASQDRR